MGRPEQLHDRNIDHSQVPPSSGLDTETALLIGRLASTVDGNTLAVNKLANTVDVLAGAFSDQRVDMQKYWSGLEKANDDIRSMRTDQHEILTRLNKTVQIDRFEKLEQHVKTLNGTDAKFRALGIDLSDPKGIEEWRDTFIAAREHQRMTSGVRTRVLQALAVTLATALCIAAWNGIRAEYFTPDTTQEQTK